MQGHRGQDDKPNLEAYHLMEIHIDRLPLTKLSHICLIHQILPDFLQKIFPLYLILIASTSFHIVL